MPNLNLMSRQPAAASEALAYTVADVQRVARLGRTKIYELLATGQLRAMKAGARTLIDAESLRRYLASLPTLQPKKAA